MKKMLCIAALAMVHGCAQAPTVSAEAKAQLAPRGELRVAVLTSNPIIGSKDAISCALAGPCVDRARRMAARAGVRAPMIEYSAINRLMQDPSKDAWYLA